VADPIRAGLVNLLSAYGYNLYDNKNRARADDLLVREKVAEQLAEAAGALRNLRTVYHRRFVPPPSRENPSPDPERMAQLRAMADLQGRLEDLETRVRGMPVPTQDRVWQRFRDERALLSQLLVHDYDLIAPSHDLRDQVLALAPSDWTDSVGDEISRKIDQVDKAARARTEFLRVPG
jgi:hypothetical protein